MWELVLQLFVYIFEKAYFLSAHVDFHTPLSMCPSYHWAFPFLSNSSMFGYMLILSWFSTTYPLCKVLAISGRTMSWRWECSLIVGIIDTRFDGVFAKINL